MLNDSPEAPTVVVMAKPARPGHVKTRLIGDLTPQQAAEVHQAMLDCVLTRVPHHLPGSLVLAAAGAMTPPAPTWRVVDQGQGDLGERIRHVWDVVGGGPAVFLGVDSPDVPAEHLAAIAHALGRADAALGPVADGGYWTLAARTPSPALLTGIDWGSADVYHQTRRRADDAGLTLAALPKWFDVDDHADLIDLRQRIDAATDPAMVQLRARLDTIGVKRRDAT